MQETQVQNLGQEDSMEEAMCPLVSLPGGTHTDRGIWLATVRGSLQ